MTEGKGKSEREDHTPAPTEDNSEALPNSKSTEQPSPRSRRSRWARWALEIGLVLAVYFGVSHWQTRHLVETERVAPSFELRTLDGRSVALEEFKGKRLLIHFWATWCGVCQREHGALNAIWRGLDEDEALVTVVADADDTDAIRRYVAEHDIEYPVLLADDRVVQQYRVSAFPTNYFIGPDGTIRSHTVGMSTRYGLSARMGCAR